MSISVISRGETISVTNWDAGIRIETFMVLGPCEHRAPGYFCVDHDLHLATSDHLGLHLANPGEHHVVVWCDRCRVYREADAATIAALVPHPSLNI